MILDRLNLKRKADNLRISFFFFQKSTNDVNQLTTH